MNRSKNTRQGLESERFIRGKLLDHPAARPEVDRARVPIHLASAPPDSLLLIGTGQSAAPTLGRERSLRGCITQR